VTAAEQEITVVARASPEEQAPPGLRLLKRVTTSKADTYLVLLPGLAPAGLKIALHPSTGDLHIKARDLGTLGRVNLSTLAEAISSGALDGALAACITAPRPSRSASAILVQPDTLPGFGHGEHDGAANLEFDVERFLDAVVEVQFDDTSEMASHLTWLRLHGHLPVKGIIVFKNEEETGPTVFLNLVPREPHDLPLLSLPDETPMRRTIERALEQLRKFGGIFITFPPEEQLRELLDRAGLGQFYQGLKNSLESMDEDSMRNTLEEFMQQFREMAPALVKEFEARAPLRPRAGAASEDPALPEAEPSQRGKVAESGHDQA